MSLSFLSKCLTCGEMARVSSEDASVEVVLVRPDLSHIEATCHCGRKMILFIDPETACNLSRNGWPVVLWVDADDSLVEFRAKVRQAHAEGKDGYSPDATTFNSQQWGGLFDDT